MQNIFIVWEIHASILLQSLSFRFLMKSLPAIGCIGQERPVITVTTSLKPTAVGHSYFLVKALPLDNSRALQTDYIKFLINAPRAINEPPRTSHIFSPQCRWTAVRTWLTSFRFLPPGPLAGACILLKTFTARYRHCCRYSHHHLPFTTENQSAHSSESIAGTSMACWGGVFSFR